MRPISFHRQLVGLLLCAACGCAFPGQGEGGLNLLSSVPLDTTKPSTDDDAALNPFRKRPTGENVAETTSHIKPGAAANGSNTPASTDDTPATEVAAAKKSKSPAGDLDAKTSKLVEDELADASPQERQEWYDTLKQVRPEVVPEILKARRMALRRQEQKGDPVVAAAATDEDSDRDYVPSHIKPASAQGAPRAPWGHAGERAVASTPASELRADISSPSPPPADPKVRPTPNAVAGLGAASPWNSSAPPAGAGRTSAAYPPVDTPGQPGGYAGRYQQAGNQQYPTDPSSVELLATPGEPTAYGPGSFAEASAGAAAPPDLVSIDRDALDYAAGRGGYPGAGASPSGWGWEAELQRLIAQVEADVAHLPPAANPAEQHEVIRRQVYLRMLYLMDQHQERALTAIPAIEPADQEFWQQMFWAISNYFDTQHIPNDNDRASQTITQLNAAVRRLQEKARLELRNVAFCHKISSFGSYDKFPRDEFSPGQDVLLYAEIENYKSEVAADGQYRTLLRSTIEILSPSGDVRKSIDFKATEDLCRNARRDYFHSYQFAVPPNIPLGPHVLKLTVFDELSGKMASYTANFMVK